MRRLLFLFLLLALPLSHAQVLLIGTTAQNPPFNSIADQKDHFYGFDIDIMGEICQRIQMRCKFTPVKFNDLFPQIKTGKIDLAIAAIIITANRQQDFLFSLPYLESNAQFMTIQQSSINKPEDIEQKRVGTRLGTPFEQLALKVYKDQIKSVEFTDIAELLDSLTNKTSDVVLMDAQAAKNWYANNSNLYKLIGSDIPVGNGYGIMANKGQTKLMTQINQALLNLEADGTYLKIYTRYFSN